MENRTLKELYTIALNNMDQYLVYGLCIMIDKIPEYTGFERRVLKKDLKQRHPGPFSKFFWGKSFNKRSYFKPLDEAYWWTRGKIEIRKKFLKHIINKL